MTWERAAACCGHMGLVSECRDMTERVARARGGAPSRASLLSLLLAYSKKGRILRIRETIRLYEKSGYPFDDLHLYNNTITGLRWYAKYVQDSGQEGHAAARGARRACLELFSLLVTKAGCLPSTQIVNNAIPCCASYSQAVRLAYRYRSLLVAEGGGGELPFIAQLPCDTLCALMECCGLHRDTRNLHAVFGVALSKEKRAGPEDIGPALRRVPTGVVAEYATQLQKCGVFPVAVVLLMRIARTPRRGGDPSPPRPGQFRGVEVQLRERYVGLAARHLSGSDDPADREEVGALAIALYQSLPEGLQGIPEMQRSMHAVYAALGRPEEAGRFPAPLVREYGPFQGSRRGATAPPPLTMTREAKRSGDGEG
eukprot:TRINITY_DN33121_c0_g1_i1.p1 TRINITY_DN33121_c0_g1~~TRINITY_DN33121_c0_g1_i1.p1  ORF type:complete len:403 (+),score=111.68 TRINITY_DN33121_c0_g1_i1:100-1209(+)